MSHESTPPVDPRDLRDHADAERIERIWQRLSSGLAHDARFERRPRRGLWLAAAASLALVFGGGVLVGRSLTPANLQRTAIRPAPERTEARAAMDTDSRAATVQSSADPAAKEHDATQDQSPPLAWRDRTATPTPPPPTRSPRTRAERANDVATEPPSAASSWLARYNSGSYADARDLLAREPGGIRGAIAAARDGFELTALAEIAWSGGDQASAVAALTRVATDFQGGQYAPIAAYKLGKFYESQGQSALAGSYAALARGLSANGNLDEDALCIQVRSAKQRAEALQMAADYLARYPHGRCKEDVERIIADDHDGVRDDEMDEVPALDSSARAVDPQTTGGTDAGLGP